MDRRECCPSLGLGMCHSIDLAGWRWLGLHQSKMIVQAVGHRRTGLEQDLRSLEAKHFFVEPMYSSGCCTADFVASDVLDVAGLWGYIANIFHLGSLPHPGLGLRRPSLG
jgi:hypothetical protein